MLPGRTITRKCLSCGNRIRQVTYRSFNNFGATLWTDGKEDDLMMPPPPWGLVKCGYCSTLAWLEDQPVTPHTEFAPAPPDDPRHYPVEPAFADYLRAITAGFESRARERHAREMAWWAGNDRRRGAAAPPPLEAVEIDNLRALLPLFDQKDATDRLRMAEAYRELGEFDAAATMLEAWFPEGHDKIADFLWDLVTRGETVVTKVTTVVL